MRHLIRWGCSALVLAALLVPWQTLHAQREGRWNVTPHIGLVLWDNASAIQDPVLSSGDCDLPELNQECAKLTNNLMAGISALYWVQEKIAVGLTFDVARPISNGAYFTPAVMEVAGEQSLSFVNQRLTVLQYAVAAEFAPSIARLSPFVNGSIGGYTVYPEAGKTDFAAVSGFETFTDIMFSVGVGLDYALGESGGIRLELRDMIYTGWEREKLNPVRPEFQTALFPDIAPVPPDESSSLNNFRLSLGFNFVPRGRR